MCIDRDSSAQHSPPQALTVPALLLAIALLVSDAPAQSTTWSNASGNHRWADPSNWTNGVPDSNTTAEFRQIIGPLGHGSIDLEGAQRHAREIRIPVSEGYDLTNGSLLTNSVVATGLPGGNSPGRISATLSPTGPELVLQALRDMLVVGPLGAGSYDVRGAAHFNGLAEHSGATILINDVLVDGGGAFRNTYLIDAPRIRLDVENIGSNVADRLNDAAELRLRAGSFSYTNSITQAVEDRIRLISFTGGETETALYSVSGAASLTLAADSIARQRSATVALSLNSARFRVMQPPALPNSGASAVERPVVPWMRGTFFNAGVAVPTLVTYDAGVDPADPTDDPGLRPLNVFTEYLPAIPASSPWANVRLTAAQTITAATSINGLVIDGGSLDLQNTSLTVSSGAVIFAASKTGTPPPPPRVVLTGGAGSSLVFPGEALLHGVMMTSQDPRFTLDVPLVAQSLTVSGNSTIELKQLSTYTGGTVINGGRLASAAQGAIGGGSVLLAGGNLSFRAVSQTYDNPIEIDSGSPSAQISVDAGLVTQLRGPLSGTGSVWKLGPGKLVLSGGGSLWSFAFLLGMGELQLNGVYTTNDPSRPLLVAISGIQTGATLSGNATLPAAVRGGGFSAPNTIAPGNDGPGRLSIYSIDFRQNLGLLVDLDGTQAAQDYDQLVVSSAVTIGGSDSALALDFGYAPRLGDEFVVIRNDSMTQINGTFAGLPEGARFLSGGFEFLITYTGGDGNDVVLTAVPEPVGVAEIVLGGILLRCRSFRSRQRAR
jgi:hypothetical protein